jgi:pantothenate kinase
MHGPLLHFILETRLGLLHPVFNKHRSIDLIYSTFNYLTTIHYPFLYTILDIPPISEMPNIISPSQIHKSYVDLTQPSQQPLYPLLLLNLKSGVSYYKVDYKFGPLKKTIGSVLGESTLSALCRITNGNTEKPTSELITESFGVGDNKNVDLTVGDIYGEGANEIG